MGYAPGVTISSRDLLNLLKNKVYNDNTQVSYSDTNAVYDSFN